MDWSACASKEQLQAARDGKLRLQFFDRDIPKEWLNDIKGKKVLCLAGAGGLQAPLLACAGAEITVIDISNKMLDKDREIARNENLQIEIVKGNMCDYIDDENGGYYKAVHRMPFCSEDYDDNEELSE